MQLEKNNDMKRHVQVLVLAVLLCLGIAACSKKEQPPPATPEAGFVVLKTESVPIVIELGGRTNAFETSDVRPQVSGILKERLFQEGSLVRAGQILYRIDPSLYRAAAAQARANLASAEATRVAADEKAKRYQPLAQIEAVSKQDYADALASARQAAASFEQNKALVETATINERYTNVAAPISGRIGRSVVTTGALVTASQADALTTIQRLDPIFVDIAQSSADLLALRRSLAKGNTIPATAEVHLLLEDGSEFNAVGTLEFAEAMVDTTTGAVTLRARFPNPNGVLLPGMYVRARLSQSIVRDAILVPQAGVSRNPQGGATVMVIGEGDKAMQRIVKTDRTIGDRWLVTDGVKAGDRVIVEGLGRIKPNQVVKPVAAGTPPTPVPGKDAPKESQGQKAAG